MMLGLLQRTRLRRTPAPSHHNKPVPGVVFLGRKDGPSLTPGSFRALSNPETRLKSSCHRDPPRSLQQRGQVGYWEWNCNRQNNSWDLLTNFGQCAAIADTKYLLVYRCVFLCLRLSLMLYIYIYKCRYCMLCVCVYLYIYIE